MNEGRRRRRTHWSDQRGSLPLIVLRPKQLEGLKIDDTSEQERRALTIS